MIIIIQELFTVSAVIAQRTSNQFLRKREKNQPPRLIIITIYIAFSHSSIQFEFELVTAYIQIKNGLKKLEATNSGEILVLH